MCSNDVNGNKWVLDMLVSMADNENESFKDLCRQILHNLGEIDKLFDHMMESTPAKHRETSGNNDYSEILDFMNTTNLKPVSRGEHVYKLLKEPTAKLPIKVKIPSKPAGNSSARIFRYNSGKNNWSQSDKVSQIQPKELDPTISNECSQVNYTLSTWEINTAESQVTLTPAMVDELGNILALCEHFDNKTFLGSTSCNLLEFIAAYLDIIVSCKKSIILDEEIRPVLSILFSLSSNLLCHKNIATEKFRIFANLTVIIGLSSIHDDEKYFIMQIMSNLGSVNAVQNVLLSADSHLVTILVDFIRTQTGTLRYCALQLISVLANHRNISSLILKENLDVTLLGFISKSRRSPMYWNETTTVETIALICVMRLVQWDDCRRAFLNLGAIIVLSRFATLETINGLRSFTALCIMIGSSEELGHVDILCSFYFNSDALVQHLRNANTSQRDRLEDRGSSGFTDTSSVSTYTEYAGSDIAVSIHVPFDGEQTELVCLAALLNLSASDFHKQQFATLDLMTTLVSIVRKNVVMLTHGVDRIVTNSPDSRYPVQSEVSLEYVYQNRSNRCLLFALEIILQLTFLFDNDDSLKQHLILGKFELGSLLLKLVASKSIDANLIWLAEAILIRLRPCIILLDPSHLPQNLMSNEEGMVRSVKDPLITFSPDESSHFMDLITLLDLALKSMGYTIIRPQSGCYLLSNVKFGDFSPDLTYENKNIFLMLICISRKFARSARCR